MERRDRVEERPFRAILLRHADLARATIRLLIRPASNTTGFPFHLLTAPQACRVQGVRGCSHSNYLRDLIKEGCMVGWRFGGLPRGRGNPFSLDALAVCGGHRPPGTIDLSRK